MRYFSRLKKNRGFTLVELMIVVAIIGVLAALAIYGVRRYLASAKTSEAKNTLGAISRGAVGAFERETTVQELLTAAGTAQGFSHDVCDDAAAVPATPDLIAGRKYQSSLAAAEDYQLGGAEWGWKCLKFDLSSPQYYSYAYAANRRGTDVTAAPDSSALIADPVDPMPAIPAIGFRAAAIGDLDGDSTVSGFAQVGGVTTDTQILHLATEITIADEYE